MENYSDWRNFPLITNKEPFGQKSNSSNMYMLENSPDFYEVIQNNTSVNIDIIRSSSKVDNNKMSFLLRDLFQENSELHLYMLC